MIFIKKCFLCFTGGKKRKICNNMRVNNDRILWVNYPFKCACTFLDVKPLERTNDKHTCPFAKFG